MEIQYDKEADALYIELKKGEFAKNRKVDDLTILDFDDKGHLLGIELLDVSKRFPMKSIKEVHVKNVALVSSA